MDDIFSSGVDAMSCWVDYKRISLFLICYILSSYMYTSILLHGLGQLFFFSIASCV